MMVSGGGKERSMKKTGEIADLPESLDQLLTEP